MIRESCFIRQTSTEQKPLDVPPPAGVDKVFSPKITSLVQDISNLSLMEVADLNECLKVNADPVQ